MRNYAFVITWLLVTFSCLLLDAQIARRNWRLERQYLERPYTEDIEKLASDLRVDGNAVGAEEVLKLIHVRDPQRQYLFLPTEESLPEPEDDLAKKIQELKNRQAERIFELAKKASAEGVGSSAFQLLNEVLYFNPEHAEVRRILGHRKTDSGWRVTAERLKVKQGTKRQPIMGWQAKSYIRVTTAHFVIDSIADEESTIELAKKLERWHEVWRQVFFDIWGNSKLVERWVQDKSKPKNVARTYQVIFFPDKQSYSEQLEPQIKGISVSSGYYSDQLEASFFYAGEETTWRHELTHQLLQEVKNGNAKPFEEGYLWLGEGIAMYLESLNDFGDYVTLGGFDAQRLQYSRIRLFRERFYVPLGKLSATTQQAFQSNPNQGRLYSQSAGMCHYLMNGENGIYQPKLIEFLKLIYQGRLRNDAFQKIVGLNDDSFESGYLEFLGTDNKTIENHLLVPLSRTEMSLGNGTLSRESMKQIARCTNLTLLDLSENQIDAADLELLADCDKLDQIFLSNCQLEAGALSKLAALESLEEVDLTASNCDDDEFLALATCSNLKSVSVRATSVSAAAITKLKAKIPGLEVRE